MFDFAWTEIALIGVVALVAIGPKDLPVAIKSVAAMVKKARRMAGEFQGHFDEMVREANLSEVRDQFNDLRRMDLKGTLEKAIDGDGAIRDTFASNPLAPGATGSGWTPPAIGSDAPAPEPATEVAADPAHTLLPPAEVAAALAPAVAADPSPIPPAFIPPAIANRPAPPAFIPPAAARA